MPEQSVIVWDLEIVPNLTAAARMLDLGNASEADVRQSHCRVSLNIPFTRSLALAL